jgi:hypothetical protein
LPKSATLDGLAPAVIEDGARRVEIHDSVKNGVLRVERSIDIPAGRTQPADYPRFSRFARQADDALSRTLQVRLP